MKKSSIMPPKNRRMGLQLGIFLLFQDDCGDLHGMAQSTVSLVCNRVARAIAGLAHQFIKMPNGIREEEIIMDQFRGIANFPGVIGALDCTHIKLRKIPGDQAQYYINRKGFYSLNVQLACACSGDGYNCPYGHKCGFDPAPPGRAPPCAQPGLTYCLHPEPYPEHVIRKLVEAGQYDIRTLLSDESREEFDARKKEYPYGYGPNSIPHVDQISLVDENLYKDYNKFQWFNHGTFSEKTPLQPPAAFDPTQYNIKRFQASNYSKFGFQGQGYQPGHFDSTNPYDYERRLRQSGQVPLFNPNYFNTQVFPNQGDWLPQASTGVTHYSPKEWWKYISPSHSGTDVTIQRSITFPTRTLKRRRRNAELVKESAKRTLTGAEALRIALGLANEDASAERPRRQLADNAEELCRVRTQYITPRAALNNRGSWKFVVNMPDNMTQLVRAEICASTECSGICTVPAGYSSRCEQKYIQKRLVALESSGQNLYTDIFWIPSCCQCTIINNN